MAKNVRSKDRKRDPDIALKGIQADSLTADFICKWMCNARIHCKTFAGILDKIGISRQKAPFVLQHYGEDHMCSFVCVDNSGTEYRILLVFDDSDSNAHIRKIDQTGETQYFLICKGNVYYDTNSSSLAARMKKEP